MNFTSFFSVQNGGKLRLETVSRDEAVAHAQKIFRDEKVISDIIEFPTSNVLVKRTEKVRK